MSTLGVNIDVVLDNLNTALDIVNVDQEAMIKFMNRLISLSSKVDQIFLSDIRVWSAAGAFPANATLMDLLTEGNKFFDSCAYLSIPVADRPVVQPTNQIDEDQIIDIKTTGRSLFFVYFMLMTKGSYQYDCDIATNRKVPAFLHNVFNFTGNTDEVFAKLANFEIKKVGTSWVEHIIMTGLGSEAQQRFALSFPGYRAFQPLRTVKPDKPLTVITRRAIRAIRKFLARGYFWEIHSATRDPTLIARFGSFNANLGNLMLEIYTDQTLQKMEDAKLIYRKPTFQFNADSYKTWDDELFDSIVRRIPIGEPRDFIDEDLYEEKENA